MKKGFTLIELLVVIAIIGILASIVLVSLSGARDSAKDSRIVTSMGQMRAEAEIANANDGSYSSFDCTNPTEMVALCADINEQIGSNPTIQATTDAYCAFSSLNSGDYYCIDSTGYATTTPTTPSADTLCNGTTFVCP